MLGIKTASVIIWEVNPLPPISRQSKNARTQYYKLRSYIRRIKRSCPGDMDVKWYASSLSLNEWNDLPVRRWMDESGKRLLNVVIIAPAHKIP